MEVSHTRPNESQFLASIIQDKTPLRGRIAIFTLSTEASSKISDKVILFIEYTQCLALFFISNYKVYGEETSRQIQISRIAIAFSRFFTPANFITINKGVTSLVLCVSYILISAFLFRLGIFCYVTWRAFKKREPSKNFVLAWKWIFWLQVRVVYFMMASIWINFFDAALKDQIQLSDIARSVYLSVCMLMIFAEFIFSLVIQTQFSGITPSNSLLSCKDTKIETLTLIQKASNQIFRRIFTGDPLVGSWIVCLMALFLSVIRLKLFTHYLSPYRIDSLFYQMHFLVMILALNIACLAQVIGHDVSVDMDFVMILWIILSGLFVKIADAYIKNRIVNLFISESKNESPEALVHKVIATKYLLKKGRPPIGENLQCSWAHLLLSTISNNLKKSFNLDFDSNALSLNSKKERNRFFAIYLEGLLAKFPKNDFLRLYTAYHYAKRQKYYGLCLKTLGDIKNSTSWKIIVSKSILLHQMKNTIINDNKNQFFPYDLSEYIDCTSMLAQIKLNMREQASFQIKICQEILGDTPNLAQIYTLGHKALSQRNSIETWAKRELPKFPDYFLEPQLVLSQYYFNVNHSHEGHRSCLNFYSKRQQKYEKVFSSGKFCQENLYRDDICTLIFSGEKENEGIVLECLGDTQGIFGRDLKGLHLSMAVPPPTRSSPKLMFKLIHEHSENSMVGKLRNRFFYNTQGFMTEVSFYCNVIPYMSQGLTYYVVSKPVKNAKEAILISKDGSIQSFTRYIGNKLDLFTVAKSHSAEEKNIKKICPELDRVNQAFNLVESSMKNATPVYEEDEKQIFDFEEAKEICRIYSEEGRILTIGNLTYKCTIKPVLHNQNGSKYIMLERQENPDDESFEECFKQEQESEDLEEVTESHNEKEKGWIDFQRLKTVVKTDGNLEFTQPPLSSQRLPLVSTQTNAMMTDQGRDPLFVKESTKKDSSAVSCSEAPQESIFSLKSQGSLAKKIKLEKLFDQAVNLPLNPFIYRFLKVGTYNAALIVIGLLIYVAVLVNSGFNSLESSKEILLIAEMRNRYLVDMNGVLSFFLGQVSGWFTLEELSWTLSVPTLVSYSYAGVNNLNDANLKLLAVTDSLTEEDHKLLFEKDVRIFDTYYDSPIQTWTTMTNFQACNLMVENTLKALPVIQDNPTESIPYIRFALRNLLNDLILKDTQITNTFLALIQERKRNSLGTLDVFFGTLIVMAIISVFLYGFLFYHRYKNEKNNLSAYTKLSKSAVRNVLHNLTAFQAMMDENRSFEGTLKKKQIPDHLTNVQVKSRQEDSEKRGALNYKGLAKPFLWISGRMAGIYLVLIALLSYDLFKLRNSFENLGDRANQLDLVDQMNSMMVFLPDVVFEMVLTNNTAQVLNIIPNSVVLASIANVVETKNRLEKSFQNEQNQIIQEMIYLDACKFFKDSPFNQQYCFKLINYQESQGLLSILGNAENLFNDMYNNYMNSDKTAESLKELELLIFQELIDPLFFSFRVLCTYLTSAVDNSFKEALQVGKDANRQLSVVIIIMMVLASFGIHFLVVDSLKKRENQFKNMLILFPPNVVLSNFILKSYLRRVSKESFESIRNEI